MKVLYLTARPPYPPHKGDQLIAWEQIKQFSKLDYEIHLISMIDSSEEEDFIRNKLKNYCQSVHFIKITKTSKLRNSIRSIFNLRPLQVNMFINSRLKNKALSIYNQVNPNIIHVQTSRVAEYFAEVSKPKTIDMIDALSLNMLRRLKNEKIFLKGILALEYILMKKYESKIIKKYDKTIVVSNNDKKYLKNNRIIVNPNGTFITPNYIKKYQGTKKDKIIMFHGNMQYYPNVEAVSNFVQNIWPKINEEYPEFKFFIVGKDPVNKIKKLDGINNVVVTGFVDDICEYLCKATIGVYPLESGTGMQNKILEALACGLPSIASPLALQGINNISKNEVYISRNNEEFYNGIKVLIENYELRDRYSGNGQSFIFNNYSWEKNAKNLMDNWDEIK